MATGQERQGTGGQGWLRASDADREKAVGVLKAAFIEGLLTRDELGERVGGALTARTYADLARATADIPAGIDVAAPPAPRTARVRRRGRPGRRAKAGACMIVTAAVMLIDTSLTGNGAGPTANGLYLLFIVAFVVAFVAWLWTLSAHDAGAQAGELPQRPAPGGPDGAARQAATAAAAGRLPSAGQARRDVAQAARARMGRRRDRGPSIPSPRPAW